VPRPSVNISIDLSEPIAKRRLMSQVGALSGLYEISLEPRAKTHSARARAYYFAAVVQPFYEFLREQDECVCDKEQAHVEIKRNVLGTREIKIGNTTFCVVRSIRGMDSAQLADFIDRARTWLQNAVGIVTLDAGEYGITSPQPKGLAAV
jgi:hypothetical protein